MKRFWLVLLSLALVMAFSVSAFAVDVKVSGEYYAAGLYLDKVSLKNTPATTFDTAFYFQRLRIGTDFIVDDSLKLVTRFDAMEREWGMRGGADVDPNTGAGSTTISPRTQENIEFDLVYVNYTSPIGLFQVGYLEDYIWGTIWGNRATGPTAGQIKYFLPIGPVTMVFAFAKEADKSLSAKQNTVFAEDLDYDSYRVGPIYKFKTDAAAGEAGILFIFNNIRNNRANAFVASPLAWPYYQLGYVFQPYFKTTIGTVSLQGELNYYTGKRYSETTLVPDLDIDALSFWLDGDAKFGIVGVGASLAFVQGDNNSIADGKINNALTGGRDWDPCLIMFNNTVLNSWVGAIPGYATPAITTAVNGEMSNAWFFQGRFNVTPDSESKLTAGMSVSYAFADKDLGSGTDRGLEVDVTGTYKITNNLSYMLGVGYLFTGDYYKAGTPGADVTDNYLVINKLTLKF